MLQNLSVTEDFRSVIVKTPFKIKVSILQTIKKEVTWQPKDELLFGFKAESKKLIHHITYKTQFS